MFSNIIRGGQILTHTVKMLKEVLRKLFFYSLVIAIVIVIFRLKNQITTLDVKNAYGYYMAKHNVNAGNPTKLIEADIGLFDKRNVSNRSNGYFDTIHIDLDGNNNSNSNKNNNINNANAKTNINNTNITNTNQKPLNKSKTIKIQSIVLANDRRFENAYKKTVASLIGSLSLFITLYIVNLFIMLLIFFLRGYFINKDAYLRGAKIVSLRTLNAIIRKHNRKNRKFTDLKKNKVVYKIANAIYPKGTETLHTIITGASGSGKTVLISDLISQIRKNGDRAIIYDRMGTFVSKFYNEDSITDKIERVKKDDNIFPPRKKELIDLFNLERDIILNPLDARSPYWSVFNEVRNGIDFDNIASALIPEGAGNIDPFWNSAARILFSSVANKLREAGNTSNKDLIDKLLTINLSEAAQLVKGTPAQAIIDEQNPKTALSVMAMISTNLKALTTLKDRNNNSINVINNTANDNTAIDNTANSISNSNNIIDNATNGEYINNNYSNENSFSIRKWIQNDNQRGFLFISSQADKHETLKPLISTWLDIAINSLLSLEQSNNRKIWLIIDELPSLHYLPSLHTGLAEARQFGGCFVLSLQLMAQLEAIYGIQKARATSGLCRNRIILNTPDKDTAQWCSDNLGKVEIKEVRENISFGASDYKDGVNINQQDIQKNIVLPTEIMQLKNLNAYVKFAGDFPIALSEFKYKNFKKTAERYVGRIETISNNENKTNTPKEIREEQESEIIFEEQKDKKENDDNNKLLDKLTN